MIPALAFGLLTLYNLKPREGEIAILPVHFDVVVFATAVLGFLLLFLTVSLLCFRKLKNIMSSEFSG